MLRKIKSPIISLASRTHTRVRVELKTKRYNLNQKSIRFKLLVINNRNNQNRRSIKSSQKN